MSTLSGEGSGEPQLADSLGYLLVRVARAHRVLVGRQLSRLDLYPGQEFLLAELWDVEPLAQNTLIARLQVEAPTVTKAVQRLERSNLVRRVRAPYDRRVVLIELTPAGRALEGPVRALWRQAEEALLAGVSAEDRERGRALLARLQSNMLVANRGEPA